MLAVAVLVKGALPAHALDETGLWSALRTPGHIALIRHALAPGTGDPDGFRVDDCSTQRNLSDGGRRQAKRTGAAFRANGITAARVLSSQWCRCKETARLMGLGPVEEETALNSFYEVWELREPQLEKLRTVIGVLEIKEPVVMVTHQVVISGLVGSYAGSGEIVVVRRGAGGALSVLGRIAPRSMQ